MNDKIKHCNLPFHQLVKKKVQEKANLESSKRSNLIILNIIFDRIPINAFKETHQSAPFLASKWLQNMPFLGSHSCLFRPLVHKQRQELLSPLSKYKPNFKWKQVPESQKIWLLNTLRPTGRAMSTIKNVTSASQWSQLIRCSPIFSTYFHSSLNSSGFKLG